MARAKTKEDWLHTAQLMQILANVNRNPKKRRKPYTWKDFHPMYAPKQKGMPGRVSISDVLVKYGLKPKE